MSYIKKGDLLVSKAYGTKYIATSEDYLRRVTSGGEYAEDWAVVPSVNTINPETGVAGFVNLRDVTLVTG